MDDHQKWHWGEGNKFAMEAMKTLLLLNGGSAVALLAFVGNLKGSNATAPLPSIGSAMLCFGLGALCAALAFIFAYLAQLEYGNEGASAREILDARPRARPSQIFHRMAYGFIAVSVSAFAAGLFFGWSNLPSTFKASPQHERATAFTNSDQTPAGATRPCSRSTGRAADRRSTATAPPATQHPPPHAHARA